MVIAKPAAHVVHLVNNKSIWNSSESRSSLATKQRYRNDRSTTFRNELLTRSLLNFRLVLVLKFRNCGGSIGKAAIPHCGNGSSFQTVGWMSKNRSAEKNCRAGCARGEPLKKRTGCRVCVQKYCRHCFLGRSRTSLTGNHLYLDAMNGPLHEGKLSPFAYEPSVGFFAVEQCQQQSSVLFGAEVFHFTNLCGVRM